MKKKAQKPWEKIRLAYATREAGQTYRALGEEFGVSLKTIAARAKKEGWKEMREVHRDRVIKKAQRKIEGRQAFDLAKSVSALEGLLGEMISKTRFVKPKSLEGLSREIRETIKTLIACLGRPADRIELKAAQKAELEEVLDWMEEASAEMYMKFRRAVGGERRTEENL